MPTRPCIECGTLTTGTRCTEHQRRRDRERPPRPTTLTRDRAEQRRRAAVVAAWVEANGYVCPGWQRPPHRATDLTADHVVAAAFGGRELAVLCRTCNGAKGAKERLSF